MARPSGLLQWQQTVSTYVPHLSQPQLTVLVLWRFGIVLAQACGVTTVAATLACVLGCSEMTRRARLRAWYQDARDKSGANRGRQRRSLAVTLCLAPLLGWVVAWTAPTCRHLALAMDASTLGQRFTILSISVAVRGCAIPRAWRVVEATRAGAWHPHWEALCGHVQGGVPADWMVMVRADRGLDARWRATGQRPARSLSCCRRGRLVILAALSRAAPASGVYPPRTVAEQSRDDCRSAPC
jgi:hypothetical protein